jgi:hypothetical protein
MMQFANQRSLGKQKLFESLCDIRAVDQIQIKQLERNLLIAERVDGKEYRAGCAFPQFT